MFHCCWVFFSVFLQGLGAYFIFGLLLWCWKKKDTWNTKRLIEKHINSSNRNKIQVNLVEQYLVNRNLRVQLGSDYRFTTQVVSHVIVSRGSGQLYLSSSPPTGWVWHKAFKGGSRHRAEAHTRPAVWKITRALSAFTYRGCLRCQAINLTPLKRVKAWDDGSLRPEGSPVPRTPDRNRAVDTKCDPTTRDVHQTRGPGHLVWSSVDTYLRRRMSPLCREYNSFLSDLFCD